MTVVWEEGWILIQEVFHHRFHCILCGWGHCRWQLESLFHTSCSCRALCPEVLCKAAMNFFVHKWLCVQPKTSTRDLTPTKLCNTLECHPCSEGSNITYSWLGIKNRLSSIMQTRNIMYLDRITTAFVTTMIYFKLFSWHLCTGEYCTYGHTLSYIYS